MAEREPQVFSADMGERAGGSGVHLSVTRPRLPKFRLIWEPRCKVCQHPGLRINIDLLYAMRMAAPKIYRSLTEVDQGKVSVKSIREHGKNHTPLELRVEWTQVDEAAEALVGDAVEGAIEQRLSVRELVETIVNRGATALVANNIQPTIGETLQGARLLMLMEEQSDHQLEIARNREVLQRALRITLESQPIEQRQHTLLQLEADPVVGAYLEEVRSKKRELESA